MSTFGFRGEALSSLCALASVSVTTRTANTNPAQRLTYDHTGALVGTAPTARAVGSTVAVKDLFKTLPVRHKVQPGAIICCLVCAYCTNGLLDMRLGQVLVLQYFRFRWARQPAKPCIGCAYAYIRPPLAADHTHNWGVPIRLMVTMSPLRLQI